MATNGKLILLCGKMGAGKSTLSKNLAAEHNAVLISEDVWLESHYPGQINSVHDYLSFAKKIKIFVKNHVQNILSTGTTVVMDFPANTKKQRQWLLTICEENGSEHQLWYLNVSDEICLRQISIRREEQPERAQFDKPEVFHEISKYFEEPIESEGLCIVEKTSI